MLSPLLANCVELHEERQVDVDAWKKYPYEQEVQMTELDVLEYVQLPQLILVGQIKHVFAVSLA